LFRRLFLEALLRAFDAGKLKFFSSLESLHNRTALLSYLAPAHRTEWVVYVKPPFAGAKQVLDYVGRYTHRVAISNHRLLDMENGQIRFLWKDYRDGGQKTLALSADEFIRRFLIHVLPLRFQRIRYYGFLGNRYREEKLALCRHLLQMPSAPEANAEAQPEPDYRNRYEQLTGHSLRQCPVCRCGQMHVIEILSAVGKHPAILDTS
jgi:hypothetical protein